MTAGCAAGRLALTLYINGASPHSIRAIENARRLCAEEFGSLADLEIVDVRQEPTLVVRDPGDRCTDAGPAYARNVAPARRRSLRYGPGARGPGTRPAEDE
jgi:hypothetical protein